MPLTQQKGVGRVGLISQPFTWVLQTPTLGLKVQSVWAVLTDAPYPQPYVACLPLVQTECPADRVLAPAPALGTTVLPGLG